MSSSPCQPLSCLFYQWLPQPDNFILVALGLAILIGLVAARVQQRNPIFRSSDNSTWKNWVTPLTTVGGILGVVLLAHNTNVNPKFVDLNIFFGALVGVGSLLYAAVQATVQQQPEAQAGDVARLFWYLRRILRFLIITIAVVLTLWAIFGEILATIFLVSVVTPTITQYLQICLWLSLVVVSFYVISQPDRAPPAGQGQAQPAQGAQAIGS